MDSFVHFVHNARLVISVRLIMHLLLQRGSLAKVRLARLLKNMSLCSLMWINHAILSHLRLLAAYVEELLVLVGLKLLVGLFPIECIPIENCHIFLKFRLIPLMLFPGSLGHCLEADAFTVCQALSAFFVDGLKGVGERIRLRSFAVHAGHAQGRFTLASLNGSCVHLRDRFHIESLGASAQRLRELGLGTALEEGCLRVDCVSLFVDTPGAVLMSHPLAVVLSFVGIANLVLKHFT